MDEKIQGIGIVLILASMLYIAGLFGQRSCHLSYSDDVSVKVKSIWRYLFEVHHADRIYLRSAFTQGLRILYFILGVGGVLLFGMPIVKPFTIWVILGGGMIGALGWIGIDVWQRISGR